ncbi:MAG: hypothetical protein UV06_C0011G0005 [Candidatus Collierbacteria bacterium GW2011_GWA2_42_17]|uniref:Uncharacterized protein n=1 Tax=Candidatus Collierbacteria bacterium GW2011_GWA2_42_17 TaxID=1618378 RepID=A0A0G1B849_9BACT|nr:MAG: hypothetical protein UV06_C0011G0005 [Candidatus Collierbacteria bacterium GW2011_GWA2_42_17]
MKLKYLFAGAVFILGIVYLTLPTPATPELSHAERSNEPGDTWQNPEQKGFYTNSDRATVIGEMQSEYAIKLNGFTIPSYRLNYRPEESFEMVRDQLDSYYLEEIVYPLRNSLFVNGWEPIHSPRFADRELKEIPMISFNGIPYISKVTLKPVNSPVWARLFVWTLIFPATYLVYFSFKKSLDKNV